MFYDKKYLKGYYFDYTVVAAGPVVTKSFPEGYIVIGGVPAKKIKDISRIKKECSDETDN